MKAKNEQILERKRKKKLLHDDFVDILLALNSHVQTKN